MTAPLPANISEADFMGMVIDLAHLRGWIVHHSRPARMASGRWVTPIKGDAGAPDLVLARNGTVWLWELKSATGTVSPAQRKWAANLGGQYRCFNPSDWPDIVRILSR